MENGVERVDGAELGENKNVGNEVNGDKIEERVVAESGGSKDLEDEVFQEAVDSPEKLQEIGVTSESVAGVETSVETPSAVLDENMDETSEVESFEEAVGVPEEVPVHGEAVVIDGDEKAKVLASGESIDKIDEGGTAEDERGYDEGETAKVGGSDGGTEEDLSEVCGIGEVQVLIGEDEVNSDTDIEPRLENLSDVKKEDLKDDASGFSALLQDNNGDKDLSDKMDTERLGDKSGDLKVDTCGVDSSSGVYTGESPMDNLESVDVDQRDERNEENGDARKVYSEHQEETPVLEAASVVPHMPDVKAAVTSEASSALSLEKPVNEVTGAQEAVIRPKDDKNSELQNADKKK